MARLLSTVFLVLLLGATGWAFALTQRAKRELSPIFNPDVQRLFSPTCGCETQAAKIDFSLRRPDRLSVWLERDGQRVHTLVAGRSYPAGKVQLAFDGVSELGETLPDGIYEPVVHLARQHRTIRLPYEIELDTKPPRVRTRRRVYTHISPDGDGRKDVFRVRYRVSEPANGILLVDGRRVVFAQRSLEGELRWNGKFDGRFARPGKHELRISAQDAAGNRATPFPFAIVWIRYVSLGRERVIARPGTHFRILVLADAPTVTWRFARGRGTARPGTLRFRAPKKPGVYTLYVSASGHADKATVVVG